eukprot:145987-Prorocentrum_minimum.AAC.1
MSHNSHPNATLSCQPGPEGVTQVSPTCGQARYTSVTHLRVAQLAGVVAPPTLYRVSRLPSEGLRENQCERKRVT